MITNIKMCNCATYDSTGIELSECTKVNFIYGPNGSGKSTISNYLSNPTAPKYSNCSITFDTISSPEIVVYNRDFREKNFSTNNSDIAGIFTLGESTIEDLNNLKELKQLLSSKENCQESFTKTLKAKELELKLCQDTFRDNVWESIYKKYSNDFKEAFLGSQKSKERFKDVALQKYSSRIPPTSTLNELQLRAQTLYNTKPESYPIPTFDFSRYEQSFSSIENNGIWSKVIFGNEDVPIHKLIKVLNNSDWVNKGRDYLSEDNICPFCQQKTITEEFELQLSHFFSGEYKEDISSIQRLKNIYTDTIIEFEELYKEIESCDTIFLIGKLDKSIFKNQYDLTIALLNSNRTAMSEKEKEPSRTLPLTATNNAIGALMQALTIAINEIKEHNNLAANYSKELNRLTDDVWYYILEEQHNLIDNYLRVCNSINSAINALRTKISDITTDIHNLKNEIINAEKKITSVQPTVDEINRSLKAYGFQNFEIVPSPIQANCYQIQRPDGTIVANTLSEGEETFISFLYFMQLAKGSIDETKISNKRILVLDDPICSLDSTVLYIVSAMIKELSIDVKNQTCDVEQLFILTHNVFFHKEASFISGRMPEDKNVHYWIINKDNNISHITPYKAKNPINTSYELLWTELKDNPSASLVSIQNTMRRIIENYFNLLGSKKDEVIVNSFHTVEEQLICKSLLHWINDGSHSIPDDIFINSYTDSIAKYKDVFRKIFINTQNEAHYNMMMGIEETK